MVTRRQSVFTCSACGHQAAKWLGHCPDCGAWNAFIEEAVQPRGDGTGRGVLRTGAAATPEVVCLSEVVSSACRRFTSGIAEVDQVLGGGIVPGSVVLLGGEPGIGKSTLLLQVMDAVASDRRVLLVCGEESPAQVKLRAERIGARPDAVRVLAETDLDTMLAVVDHDCPDLLVVDSVQTLYTSGLSSAPGSVSQVREAASQLQRLAKKTGTVVFLVGHVTKDGTIAGPRALEHIVDTVLEFEGDRHRVYRVLRATKNRFGSTNEVGIFEMGSRGLLPVSDLSHLFLSDREPGPGACIHIAAEGTRCFLVEVQALVHPSELSVPRRVTTSTDRNRLAMIVAVLGRHTDLPLSGSDVFVNIAGGIRMEEPAADLAMAVAIASAARRIPPPSSCAVFGEVSLTGEIRSCRQSERRVTEALRSGFTDVLVPGRDKRLQLKAESSAHGVQDIAAAFASIFGTADNRDRHCTLAVEQGV